MGQQDIYTSFSNMRDRFRLLAVNFHRGEKLSPKIKVEHALRHLRGRDLTEHAEHVEDMYEVRVELPAVGEQRLALHLRAFVGNRGMVLELIELTLPKRLQRKGTAYQLMQEIKQLITACDAAPVLQLLDLSPLHHRGASVMEHICTKVGIEHSYNTLWEYGYYIPIVYTPKKRRTLVPA